MDTGFRGEGGTGEGRRFDLSLPGGVVSDLQNVPIWAFARITQNQPLFDQGDQKETRNGI